MDGMRLSELRKSRRMSQKELAALLSVSVNTISLYERGISTPSDEMKLKIARLFSVSLDYLLGHEKEEEKHSQPQVLVLRDFPPEAENELLSFLEYLKGKYGVTTLEVS